MAFSKDEVKRRVQDKVNAGDFFFPEDLARAVAKELGVDTEGTPFGQDAPANSRTRGDVPPFSGRPSSEEAGMDASNKAVAAFDKAEAERAKNKHDGSERITRESLKVKDEDFGVTDKVEEEGPVYPDDASTSTDVVSADANDSSKKKTTKKKG